MRYDKLTVQNAELDAINFLGSPMIKVYDPRTNELLREIENEFYVPKDQITAPATLVQEQQYVNSKQIFTFDFTLNAPKASSTLNNVNLPKNNVAAVYGIQFLLGYGGNANNRYYLSHGSTVADGSIYNSNCQMKIETDTVIDICNGQDFQEVYTSPLEFDSTSGLKLIRPLRILTGELGVFQVSINLLNSISSLKLTDDVYLSMRLLTAMGQASGKAKK